MMTSNLESSFSVVLPTYNRATLVCRAVESVLAQTVPPREIIVVDDGSTDDTAEALAAFGDAIRYVRQENSGCSAARNRGVAESAAEWIAFLDSDDTWTPAHLESMTEAIVSTSGRADLYFADSVFPLEEGRPRKTLWSLSDFEIDGSCEVVDDGAPWVMRPRQPMKLQCSVFRRSLFETIGGLDEALLTREDTHFFLRAGLGHSLCAVKDGGVSIGVDDLPENRLTLAYPPGDPVYLAATVRLYRDVLRRAKIARSEDRSELRRRLTAARLRLARREMRSLRKFARGCARATFACASGPAETMRMIGRRAARFLP